MPTLEYTETLVVTSCFCGINLAVPHNLHRRAKEDKSVGIYCPLGHQFFFGDTENERLKRQLEAARKERDWQQHRREQAEAHARSQKARATRFYNDRERLKVRVQHGVCPCCHRTFKQLSRHMKSKHPEFQPPTPEPVNDQ